VLQIVEPIEDAGSVGYREGMDVVRARIQTVKDIYRLVRTAVVSKRPVRAVYHGRERWFCPHRLGRNHEAKFVCCAISMLARAAVDCKQ
jgi:hypothetical protein